MAYGNVSGVAARCKELIAGNATFTDSTTPSERQVQNFLNDASALMDAVFASLGFTTPITDTDVTPILDPIAEYYAAMEAESTRLVERSNWEGAAEESKPTHWKQLYDNAMKSLTNNGGFALMILGAGKARDLSYGLHAGGLSDDERDTWNDDSDFTRPRFTMGMMENATTNWSDV